MNRLLLLLIPFSFVQVKAQITVATLDSKGAETLVNSLIDLGAAHAGDILDTRFRLRNTGAAAVTLQALRVSGAGFTTLGYPPLPYIMAAGTNVDFRVRFQPQAYGSFSATLIVNDRGIILRATAPAGVTVLMDRDGGLETLSNELPIDFGRAERGQSLSRRFLLRNDTPASLTVTAVTLSGPPFDIPSAPALPLRLTPTESAAFEIRFSPPRAGILESTLGIDGRVFRLQGTALDIPFPEAQIILPSPTLPSGQQGRLTIRLAAPSRSTGTGTLKLTFQPSVDLARGDDAIQFLASGTRAVTLRVNEGETTATLDGQPDVLFQTGTTAGTITFKLDLGIQSREASITIPPAAITIDSTRLARSANAVEVAITAFDNTRTASQISFQFSDRAGRPLTAQPLRTDAAPAFAQYFRDSTFGGMFLLRAVFPVSGDPAEIAAVEVALTNSVAQVTAR